MGGKRVRLEFKRAGKDGVRVQPADLSESACLGNLHSSCVEARSLRYDELPRTRTTGPRLQRRRNGHRANASRLMGRALTTGQWQPACPVVSPLPILMLLPSAQSNIGFPFLASTADRKAA